MRRNPYESDWYYAIESIAQTKKYPFNDWFEGYDRLYYQLPERNLSEDDYAIIKYLENRDYEIIDYRQGLARRIGSHKIIKIGKMLQRFKKNCDGQECKIIEELIKAFEKSPYRIKGDLVIVISQNPHDIAKMSTDRGWKSCLALDKEEGSEAVRELVFCEAEEGGFIAYVIYSNDPQIKKPLSRILIRRFESLDGESVAMAETRMYGAQIPEFLNFVEEWIHEKQGKIRPAFFQMKGGYSTSDTLPLYLTEESAQTVLEIKDFLYNGTDEEKRKAAEALILLTRNPQAYKTLQIAAAQNENWITKICAQQAIIKSEQQRLLTYGKYRELIKEMKIKSDPQVSKLLLGFHQHIKAPVYDVVDLPCYYLSTLLYNDEIYDLYLCRDEESFYPLAIYNHNKIADLDDELVEIINAEAQNI